MPVIVVLTQDLAERFLRPTEGDKAAETLRGALGSHGEVLTPVHPRTTDRVLSTHFQVNVDDRETAENLAGVLRGLDGVEGAYWKPAAEAP